MKVVAIVTCHVAGRRRRCDLPSSAGLLRLPARDTGDHRARRRRLERAARAIGEVSLGQGGFMALGAYGVAILTTKAGLGFWEALPLAVFLSAAISAALSIPALRVTGPYLAMVTIAFGFIVESGLGRVAGSDRRRQRSGRHSCAVRHGRHRTVVLRSLRACPFGVLSSSSEAHSVWRCRQRRLRRQLPAASASAPCQYALRPSCWPRRRRDLLADCKPR